MGTVYEARQDSPRRTVALKLLHPEFASRWALRRLEHEAEVLGRLQHPGIAQILEAGTFDSADGPQPFFAMELVSGEPLLEHVERNRLSVPQRLQLMARIADAVEHAHKRGIVHRDLKPANIMVTGDGLPKVLDFGVARTTDADLQSVTLQTAPGELVGTVPYMSPEQAAGDPAGLDTRTDVYSLGVVTFELLTGRLPYDVRDEPMHEVVRAIREDEPMPLSTVHQVLRGDVETIVRKALEKENTRRYQSAAVVAGAATAIMLLLGGTAISLWQARVADEARVAAELAAATAERRAMQATLAASAAALERGDSRAATRMLDDVPTARRRWEWAHLRATVDGCMARVQGREPFMAAALGADGMELVTVSGRGTVQSWDPLRGEPHRTLALPGGPVLAAAFDRDLRRLVTAQGPEGRRLMVWDAATGAPVSDPLETEDPVRIVAISPSGERVAAVRSRSVVDVWDLAGAPAVRRIDGLRRVTAVEFGPDGTRLVVSCASATDSGLRICDAATGEVLGTLDIAADRERFAGDRHVASVLSSDGRRIAAARAFEARVEVADASTGAIQMALTGHKGVVHSLAFSPDGARLVTAGHDGARRLWDLLTGRELALHTTPETVAQTSIEFSRDGRSFVTCGSSGVARLFDATGDDSTVVLRGHGSYVATRIEHSLSILSVATGLRERCSPWATGTGPSGSSMRRAAGRSAPWPVTLPPC